MSILNDIGSFFGGIADNIGSIFGGVGNAAGRIGDIITGDPGSTDSNLLQDTYDFTQRVFPSDIGESSYNGHYIVININVQDESQYATVNKNPIFSPTEELSKVDSLRYNIDTHYRLSEGQDASTGNSFTRPRFTKRVKESIALYMPNSELSYSDVHTYEEISLTSFAVAAAGGLAKFVGAGVAGGIGRAFGLGGAAAAGAGSLIDATGQVIGSIAQLTGSPINPKAEVLFANTGQREFTFDFLFAPSNEKESRELEQIIRTLRFHAAPELRANSSLASFFFVPPSEFDITFFYRGKENRAIPRINTCVLTRCDVSVAPGGTYSTFYNGHPVQVRMMLQFRETEIVHKLRVLQGF